MRGGSAGRDRPRRPDREKWTTAEERSRTWTTKDGRKIPLGRRFDGRPWTPEEDNAIRTGLGRESLAEVGARIGRTKSAVRYRRWKLGLEPDDGSPLDRAATAAAGRPRAARNLGAGVGT